MRIGSATIGSDQGSQNGSNRNYGEYLYQRGMRRKEEMQKKVFRAKSEHDRQELEKYSFKPKINDVSKLLTRANQEKPEDFLIKYGKAVREKIDHQRVQYLREETEGLSFKPQVSKISEKIVQ